MSDKSPKERAADNLNRFLETLNQFDEGWEEDTYTQDDHDGVSLRSPNQLVAEETARKLVLRRRFEKNQSLFDPSDEIATFVKEVDENDINRRLTWGYTPLIKAAVDGNLEECKRLKAAGADLTLKDNSGKMAWQKAQSRGFVEIMELLKP